MFVQFELHRHNHVDIRKVPDMPSESWREEYSYWPCDLMPPVGERLMAHLFYHPEEANELGITVLRAPKKRKEKLIIHGTEGTKLGWGLHLVEGWEPFRIWMVVLVFFDGGSLVFGICWSVFKHDLQVAFGVSAWIVTLGGLILGTLQTGLG